MTTSTNTKRTTFSGREPPRPTDNRPIADLKNIGPITARNLLAVGISREEDLRQVGAVEAYRRVKTVDPKGTTLVLLYALQGALTDTYWNDLPAPMKNALREALQHHP
ncbi:MAG: competence protein TfoX [Alphaproteobacteria bacterium]|nr:competence protein TfoX [Alphaproteobacteria bacterium]